MTFAVTGLYASLLAILLIILTYWVVVARAKTGVSILHGEDLDLALRIRQQGNLIENVPMAIILMGIAEAQGAPSAWLHAIGLILLVSRIIHPLGLDIKRANAPMRIIGVLGTHAAMLACLYLILWPMLTG